MIMNMVFEIAPNTAIKASIPKRVHKLSLASKKARERKMSILLIFLSYDSFIIIFFFSLGILIKKLNKK